MSKITNEIRRTRRKLELFDQEGLNDLLLDLLDEATSDAGLGYYGTKERQKLIDKLKRRYQIRVAILTPSNPKQTKLNL